MEFFIDTALVSEVEQASRMGLRGGVTTNPTLMKRAVGEEGERDPHARLREICNLVDGPVSAEVLSVSAEDMVQEAIVLTKIDPTKVVIKCPMNAEGLKACHALSKMGVRTNVTLVFTVGQAVRAAWAGATYVSIFVGRLDHKGVDGMNVVKRVLTTFRTLGLGTKVLVASVRHPLHVFKAIRLGAHAITIPFSVITELSAHELTTAGIQTFLEDGKKAGMTR